MTAQSTTISQISGVRAKVTTHVWALLVTIMWFTILPIDRVATWFRADRPHLTFNLTVYQYLYLPLVGATMAAVAVGFAATLAFIGFPVAAAATLAAVLIHVSNGGIHLDGAADTTDALFAYGKNKLAVMTDPHIGGLGAAYMNLTTLTHVTLSSTAIYLGLTANSLLLATPIVAALVSRVLTVDTLHTWY